MKTGKFMVYAIDDLRRDGTLEPYTYFYFNLCTTTGHVIATSEMYETKRGCLNGIKSVQKNAPTAVIEYSDEQLDRI